MLNDNCWSSMAVSTALSITGAGSVRSNITGSPLQFMRAKLTLPALSYITVALRAVCREP